jgi:hypothetical protein
MSWSIIERDIAEISLVNGAKQEGCADAVVWGYAKVHGQGIRLERS